MGKIVDYLHWRGDLSFTNDPLNDVDTLILALLSYLPIKGLVPGIESHRDISLKDAARQYFSKNSITEEKPATINATASSTFNSELEALFKKTASRPRFEEIRLSGFEENTDFVIGQQFAAVTFTLPSPEPKKVIAFRGTDSSVVGWKEDFELVYRKEIPAQKSACTYLEHMIRLFPGQFVVCGHSKGGNLAMYAGSHLDEAYQSRLMKIINFDGPGFDFSIVPRDPFLQHENKINNYVPEESLVGLLLDSTGKRTVVSSAARFVFQHNALNWEVEHTNFVQGSLSNNAKLLEHTLKTWLPEISLSEREMFLEALFELLGASDGDMIKIDPQENLQVMNNILKKYSKLDKETKTLLAHVFKSLNAEARNTLSATIVERSPLSKRKRSTQ